MVSELIGRIIFFATDNVNKFNEARRLMDKHKLAVGLLRVKAVEIQSESLEEIARASVLDAFRKCNLPLIVEDAGLFIEALNGFPGPYAAYVYKTLGNKGLMQLMETEENRKATFHSVVAHYSTELESPICFKGEAPGEITVKEGRGNDEKAFGFDPIFKPMKSSRTFAQMSIQEKNKHSHRARALRKFAEWYKIRRSRKSEHTSNQ